jgi:proteasome lid subunit RPN8/RPN11
MTATIPDAVRRAIVAHARRERPNECCGLLLGRGTAVQFAVPMENVLASPTRYRISDAAHIECRRFLRAFAPALSVVGVYHSHPAGAADPSPRDLAEAMYPEWLYAIVGLAKNPPSFQVFRISRGRARKLSLKV